MLNRHPQTSITQSKGAALITALLILLVLTIIGISALRTSSLQETIVGNMRDQDLAFQATESAVTEAELNFSTYRDPPLATPSASQGIYTKTSGTVGGATYDWANSASDTAVWTTGVATEFGTSGTQDLAEVNADPMYVVQEELFTPDDLNPETRAQGLGRFTYKITARGEGKADTTVILLQETYAKRYK